MKIYILILPQKDDSYFLQLNNCLEQLSDIAKDSIIELSSVVKMNLFVSTGNYDNYIEIKRITYDIFNSLNLFGQIPISIIPQPPAKFSVALEVIISGFEAAEHSINFKKFKDINYIVAEYPNRTEIISGGIHLENPSADINTQADYCMKTIGEILQNEGFTFSDIVRQWNYVGNICNCILLKNCINQNYQIFNDVRSKYYNTDDWKNGYPASTGIGISLNRIITDFIALKPKSKTKIIPLRNPRQADAHNYSTGVLKGIAHAGFDEATTPKFERGKIVLSDSGAEIYVSGTAAIIGQDSLNTDDVETQTEVTIENILELVSVENLLAHGADISGKEPHFDYLRVYMKNIEDYKKVRLICEKYFPGVTISYLQADVCRFELLVEIEAYLTI
jgi:enamine deaminase RidA (YjgF/YER057c/UK114 family)